MFHINIYSIRHRFKLKITINKNFKRSLYMQNIKVRESDLRFFEIGNVFEIKTKGEIKSFDDFEESEHLMISITGNAVEQSWYDKGRPADIFDLKGIVTELIEKLNLSDKRNLVLASWQRRQQ